MEGSSYALLNSWANRGGISYHRLERYRLSSDGTADAPATPSETIRRYIEAKGNR
jgi:hypothetical protein